MAAISITNTHASSTAAEPRKLPRAQRWIGLGLSGFSALFLTFDTAFKLSRASAAIEGTQQLGYASSVILPLGLIELACLVLYLFPRTAALGALLWTGYLGGAVATHVRLGNSLFGHVLFPVYVAAMLWGGLWLRDERVRALFAPRTRS